MVFFFHFNISSHFSFALPFKRSLPTSPFSHTHPPLPFSSLSYLPSLNASVSLSFFCSCLSLSFRLSHYHIFLLFQLSSPSPHRHFSLTPFSSSLCLCFFSPRRPPSVSLLLHTHFSSFIPPSLFPSFLCCFFLSTIPCLSPLLSIFLVTPKTEMASSGKAND